MNAVQPRLGGTYGTTSSRDIGMQYNLDWVVRMVRPAVEIYECSTT